MVLGSSPRISSSTGRFKNKLVKSCVLNDGFGPGRKPRKPHRAEVFAGRMGLQAPEPVLEARTKNPLKSKKGFVINKKANMTEVKFDNFASSAFSRGIPSFRNFSMAPGLLACSRFQGCLAPQMRPLAVGPVCIQHLFFCCKRVIPGALELVCCTCNPIQP